MSGTGQSCVTLSATLRSLVADRVLQISLVVYGVAIIVLALSFAGSEGPADGLRAFVDPALLGTTVLALLWGRARLVVAERRFWDLLALAWACWLLVELLYFFEVSVPFFSASFVTDALYILYYLIFALAVDLRPHLDPERTLTALGRRIESSAGLAAVFGLLIYFALVVFPEPLGLSLSFVSRERGFTQFLLVRLSLGLLILARLIYAASAAHGRWFRLYVLLAAGMFCYGLRDATSLLQYEGVVSVASLGFVYQVFLYLPGFVILVAARYRHLPTAEEAGDRVKDQSHEGGIVRASPVALYALVVPGIHFLFYPLGLLEPASRTVREVFSLVYVVILGVLAWIHQSVIAKDNRMARTALRRAEERLSRSQKLESVGRLAGGIAHDFNNYLTVIGGYSELLRERLRDPEEQAGIENIQDAARKATHLTRQLLAFGRRQVLRPEALDLNAVVRDTVKMLDSLLGEDVDLEVDLAPDTGLARADLGQTEQVLVNLAINGRDAMPGGGSLAIRTRRVELSQPEASQLELEPGAYVGLAVSDTGTGMSDEVLSQVFEPFFTTKQLGRGTGLGLSTVYGIVNQSGGAITVDSAPGKGTTVRVLLPSASAQPIVERASRLDPVPEPMKARLLLVEDEEAVRRLAQHALSRAGFQVQVASGGREALHDHLDSCESIDLLITDVLMPGMDGVELAGLFRARCPLLPVLFVSGYPVETLRERLMAWPESTRLLEKPFSPGTLVKVASEVLEETCSVTHPDLRLTREPS
jgi:signal transduction histidine kinase/CheY-like chemotaxis protein